MPDFEADYPDMVEPAYILFEDKGGGEFAFGCCTGHIWTASSTEATSIDFSWDGSDEMDQVNRTVPPNSSQTAPSTAKSATTTATNIPSSLENGLLQQPAKSVRRKVLIWGYHRGYFGAPLGKNIFK